MLGRMDDKSKTGIRIVDWFPRMWGRVRIEAFRNGVLFHVDEDSNVVVNNGKVHQLRLQGGISGFTPVSKMELADGGCGLAPSGNALFTPVPFVVTDTGLRQPFSTRKVSSIDTLLTTVDSGARTITYVAFFSSAGTVGYHYVPHVVNEIALRSGAEDVAIALRSFRSIPFDPTDAVDIKATWTIGLP